MNTCIVRWRPSGGRGEYEFVPSSSLMNRDIVLHINGLGVSFPTEVKGVRADGKPRLRKNEPNNRKKLHLVPLVMSICRLPEPAREDKHVLSWPLDNKGFIVSSMEFEILDDDGITATLRPISAKILHAEDKSINLDERISSICKDLSDSNIAAITARFPELAAAMEIHKEYIMRSTNDRRIRDAANDIMRIQSSLFGNTNSASISLLVSLPETNLENDVVGKEGRILTRLHSYRERDRGLVSKAKRLFKKEHGVVFCECCGIILSSWYGARAEDRIQAHHRTPVEELLPDNPTTAADLAMVCPNCHDIIHARRPWMSVEQLHEHLITTGNHFFGSGHGPSSAK